MCRAPEAVTDSGAARVVPLLKSETESGHLGSCREVDGDAGAFLCRPEPDIPRQCEIPEDGGALSAEDLVQRAAGVWATQPRCGVLPGEPPDT